MSNHDSNSTDNIYSRADQTLAQEVLLLHMTASETESTYASLALHQSVFCILALAAHKMEAVERIDTKIFQACQTGMAYEALNLRHIGQHETEIDNNRISPTRLAINPEDYRIIHEAWEEVTAKLDTEN